MNNVINDALSSTNELLFGHKEERMTNINFLFVDRSESRALRPASWYNGVVEVNKLKKDKDASGKAMVFVPEKNRIIIFTYARIGYIDGEIHLQTAYELGPGICEYIIADLDSVSDEIKSFLLECIVHSRIPEYTDFMIRLADEEEEEEDADS
jgi:hypothetical protein